MDSVLGSALPNDPLLAVLSVFVAGLFSVFTPCVLPMVPITLATMGVTHATSRWKAALTAIAYVLGIVLTFTVMGILFALTGTLFGSLLAHPAAAITIAVVFTALAASCFDIIAFQLPQRLTRTAARIGGHGPLGAFGMGLVAGFIAAPCIGPILAAILSYVATTRDAGYGGLLLASYGTGFGLPFLLVGVFALRLPKAGPWMEAVKGVFGILLLIGAFWFLRGAFPALRFPTSLHISLVALASALTMYVVMIAFFEEQRIFKVTFAAMAVVSGAFALNAAMRTELAWCNERPEKSCVAEAMAAHPRVVMLFGAEWCTACHELQNGALSDPRVMTRLSSYGTVLVDVDVSPELAERYVTDGLPLLIVIDKDGNKIDELRDNVPAKEVIAWIDRWESAWPEPAVTPVPAP